MDKETTKIAKKFVKKIKKIYSPEKIILFGSRARGDNFRKSDFDFIIVSKKFEGIPFMQRLPKIYNYWDESFDIEAVCYTPDEFMRKAKEHGIVRKAIKEGIELN
jgi:hypothetical protein